MKRSADIAERATAPVDRTESLLDGVKWPGYVLLAYTVAWFFVVSSFISR